MNAARDLDQFVRVEFARFKAFRTFKLHLRHFNILVGPNNAGKSTILAAFRILAAGLRRANTRKPQLLPGPDGQALGHIVDLSAISIAEENIFYNYDDSEPALVKFSLSNRKSLTLYFPDQGTCYLFPEASGKPVSTPSQFRNRFACPIGFVPILGPVEHNETLYEKEAARLALFNYRAARNFRNIWHHYPERFDEFREILRRTWPGMDIERPEIDFSYRKPVLHMFCPEERIPREIFWAGFGFQVWCQMLTHVVQSSESSIFLIDEPDIYLHSDLQRQLLTLLKNLGPDILIATHSTEIIIEAETDDIVLIDKRRKASKRIKDPADLAQVFSVLGSNLNPILTQLAKTRRAVFVEGKDFQVLGKFARKIGKANVGNRSGFAVVPVEGFSPDRIKTLVRGIETTLGTTIVSAAILDRDYRSDAECNSIRGKCNQFCDLTVVLRSKEVENFLLVPDAIDRAAEKRVRERALRTGVDAEYSGDSEALLLGFSQEQKSYVTSQRLAAHRRFRRGTDPSLDETTVSQEALEELELEWKSEPRRLQLIPGKEGLTHVNQALQEDYGVSLTPAAIIDAMTDSEIPGEIKSLIERLDDFSKTGP